MKQTDVKVPPILLEGDQPTVAPAVDETEKFALGPGPETEPAQSAESALSDSYGTGRILLIARDPNCLYAHWDLTEEQQKDLSGRAGQGQLQVRLFRESDPGTPVKEIPIEPESHHSFVEVTGVGATYVAELGFATPSRPWNRIAVSEPVTTPSASTEARSHQPPIQFATLTFDTEQGATLPPALPALGSMSQEQASQIFSGDTSPGISGLERRFPFPPLPAPAGPWEPQPIFAEAVGSEAEPRPESVAAPYPAKGAIPVIARPPEISSQAGDWTPSQERALAELIGWCFLRRQGWSSADLAESAWGEFQRGAVFRPSEPGAIESARNPGPISSEALLPPKPQGFWLNVNAELVIYGATEPGANLTLGGQPVDLRPDGTFSCRFALPDGFYPLQIEARSVRGEIRPVELDFSRTTVYSDEVGSQPRGSDA